MTIHLLTALGSVVVMGGCHPETEGNTRATGGSPGEELLKEWNEVTLVDELWKVGRFDGAEYEVLGRIGDVAFVGAGLVVSDSYSNRIHWYDSSGQHEVSAGGSGGGPGEFVMVRNLDVLPDGTLAALNVGGNNIEFFSKDGDSTGTLRVPGTPWQMCLIDSTLVVLGSLGGSNLPLHLIDLADGAWTSIGPDGPGPEDPLQEVVALNLLEGVIDCMDDRIVYARHSDGTVRALHIDGLVLWEVEIPSYVPMVIDFDAGEGMGIHPPDGATEVNVFKDVTRVGRTLAVQVERRHLISKRLLAAAA